MSLTFNTPEILFVFYFAIRDVIECYKKIVLSWALVDQVSLDIKVYKKFGTCLLKNWPRINFFMPSLKTKCNFRIFLKFSSTIPLLSVVLFIYFDVCKFLLVFNVIKSLEVVWKGKKRFLFIYMPFKQPQNLIFWNIIFQNRWIFKFREINQLNTWSEHK